MNAKLEFKIANEDWEFKQIHELNYKTFVEEIPQHSENSDKSLLDKFHSENTYIICTRDRELLGMMAVRDKRPFSLDQKLNDIESYLPKHNFACEFRLLSIEKEVRNLRIIQGLMVILAKLADDKGYDIALISANVKRLRFYQQVGFKSFGPQVGTEEAKYQPMYLTLKSSLEFRKKSKILSRIPNNFAIKDNSPINLLPGPVDVSAEVKKAMTEPAVSHRSEEFRRDFQVVQSKLCQLTGAKKVEVLMGSGSLANDAVAAQLSRANSKGLVLSNGEFGERLIDHATRYGLNFEVIQIPWGAVFNYNELEDILANSTEIDWLWVVHSETSTGVLNDLVTLRKICSRFNINLCLDCVSSIGALPIDLSDVYLASGVSGKCIGSYPGLSFVFYNHEITSSNSILRSIDLGFYADSNGIPFTISSNLVYALSKAIDTLDEKERYIHLEELSNWTREQLHNIGFNIISNRDNASPGLITISLPSWLSSSDLGNKLQDNGYLLHWRSQYLLDRNWIQIALISRYNKNKIKPLFQFLSGLERPFSKAL